MTDDRPTTPTDEDDREAAGDLEVEAHDDATPEREPEEQARRVERLRRSLLAVDPSALKRALKALPQPVVEALAKEARVRVPVLGAGSTKPLRRVGDPVLLDTLAGVVCADCLDAIRSRLGDEADDPEPEAVAAAVDEVTGDEFPVAMVRLTLAMVAAGFAEAADTCDEIVDRDPRFELADESERDPGAPPSPPVPSTPVRPVASEEKRAARRARQAAEAERRRAQQEKAAAEGARRKAARKRSHADSSADGSESGESPSAAKDGGLGTLW